jgi:uncharacterized protein
MKFLLLVLAVIVLFWLIRSSLRRPPPRQPSARDRPQQMLACQQCGVHLPQDEALPGRGGVFCGEAHRAAYEKAHPE